MQHTAGISAALADQRPQPGKEGGVHPAVFEQVRSHVAAVGEGGFVGTPHTVLVCLAGVTAGHLCRIQPGQVVFATGRRDIQVQLKAFAGRMIQSKYDFAGRSGCHLGQAEVAAVRSPRYQVAQSGRDGRTSLGIGLRAQHGVEFGIVVEAEVDVYAGGRCSVGMLHANGGPCHAGVVFGDVDFGIAGGAAYHFLGSVVAAKDLGVHQHAARGRCIEPAQIQHGFGFTGAQEVPLAVHPGLHPSVVVVGVCPPRGVDLACGDAHGAQRCHGKGALLAAAAYGGAHTAQWGRRASVRGAVGHVFVTPVVDFEHGLVHREATDTLAQFLVAHRAEAVQVFVVHPHGQDEMQPFPFGHAASPGHFAACAQACLDLFDIELRGVVGHVGQAHVGIEEPQRPGGFGRSAVYGAAHVVGRQGEQAGLIVRTDVLGSLGRQGGCTAQAAHA